MECQIHGVFRNYAENRFGRMLARCSLVRRLDWIFPNLFDGKSVELSDMERVAQRRGRYRRSDRERRVSADPLMAAEEDLQPREKIYAEGSGDACDRQADGRRGLLGWAGCQV